MEIIPIFESTNLFWAPCYLEDNGDDIFTVLFEKFTNTEYLQNFFKENLADLSTFYGHHMTVDEAESFVINEIECLQEKLICNEYFEPHCKDYEVGKIFEPFSKNDFIFRLDDRQFLKGKLNSLPQMIRLYGIKLEDDTIIITGGAIKLSYEMNRSHINHEMDKIQLVADYLKSNLIFTKDGLL